MSRVTLKNLEAKVEYLNHLTNSPTTYSTKHDDGTYTTNAGNFHLYQAYGGVELYRVVNDGGGANCPAWEGCLPKREASALLTAFIHGIELGMGSI
jgi:hypothetical protein